MSIAAIVTRGYGSFGSIGDVTRAGYEAAAGAGVIVTPQATITLVGDGQSWQDYVTAENKKNLLQKAVAKEEKKLERIEKQIAREMKKVKASEHPEGILANIFKLEMGRDELENKIEAMRIEMIPIEAFLQAEIDEDDEDIKDILGFL